jgi:protein-glutamine gamma-glutamyltransferase
METYFRITSYALVATAFLALALTGQLDAVSVVLYAGAVGISFVRDRQRKAIDEQSIEALPGSRWRIWAWRGLVALYVPFLFFDATLLTNRVLALVHLALFASAMKLLQPKRDRDWVFLYVMAFFMMLLSAGLTFNATFVGSLALFLFFFVSTLAAFEVRRAQREIIAVQDETIVLLKPLKPRASDKSPAGSRRRVRYLMGASFAQLAIVGLLTLPFFFMIPRFGGGVAQGFAETPATGFSDKVELGQVARIKKSQQVVMRIQLDRNPGRYLRWRGVALDQYEKNIWSVAKGQNGQSRDQKTDNLRNFPSGIVEDETPVDWMYKLVNPAPPRESLNEQKIILEPLDTPTLFAAQKAIWLRGPMGNLHWDFYSFALTTNGGLRHRTAYSVWSDLSTPSEPELRAETLTNLPEDYARLYLQLPRKLNPRIRQMAHDITREASAVTPFDKARAIETYLKTRFGYTLNLTINGDDPLTEFLFDVREGHCEYFATAMVIMLRTLDIPARIVNGFQMGEYNDVNRMFTVRQSDAHSWVEVYFPHAQAWVEFDPTPAAGINDYSQGGLLSRFRKYMDAMEVFWLNYIVTLDSDQQASIIVGLQRRLAAVKDRMMDYYNSAKQWAREAMNFIVARDWQAIDWLRLASLLILLMMAGGTIYVLRHLKQWSIAPTGYGPWWHRWFILPTWKRRRLARRDERECAVMFYEQMLAIASRAGLIKPTHQTPVEFAAANGFAAIHEITALYNRVRFGGASLDEAETRRVSQLLAELKRNLKKTSGRKRPAGRAPSSGL